MIKVWTVGGISDTGFLCPVSTFLHFKVNISISIITETCISINDLLIDAITSSLIIYSLTISGSSILFRTTSHRQSMDFTITRKS